MPVYYPPVDSIRLEDKEEATYIVLVISDMQNHVVRKLKQTAKKGLYSITWDGHLEVTSPVSFYTPDPDNPYESGETGPMALPGKYQVRLELVQGFTVTKLCSDITFNIITLNNSSLAVDRNKLEQFNNCLLYTSPSPRD